MRGTDAGGKAIIDLIDGSGLPLSDGGIRNADPAYFRMEELPGHPKGSAYLLKQ